MSELEPSGTYTVNLGNVAHVNGSLPVGYADMPVEDGNVLVSLRRQLAGNRQTEYAGADNYNLALFAHRFGSTRMEYAFWSENAGPGGRKRLLSIPHSEIGVVTYRATLNSVPLAPLSSYAMAQYNTKCASPPHSPWTSLLTFRGGFQSRYR